MLELPMVDDYSDTAAMLRATQRGHVLVNGFSGYAPPHYDALRDAIRRFDPGMLFALERTGPLLVFVHQGEQYDKYTDYVEQLPNAHRVQTTAAGALYQLPRVAPSHDPDQTGVIASIAIDGDVTGTATMVDGQLSTRAEAHGVTAPRDSSGEMVITFNRPIAVSAIDFDLGALPRDYPIKLRISAVNPGEAPRLVWEGATRGAEAAALLEDRTRHAVKIELAAPIAAPQLLLTITDGNSAFWWSVAELKVFGR